MGTYHTHPSSTNEPTYGCPGFSQVPGDGLPVPKADPNSPVAGGGSTDDWNMTNQGFPVYSITKTGRIYRLDPNTPVADRGKNPNKWELNSNAGCPTVIP